MASEKIERMKEWFKREESERSRHEKRRTERALEVIKDVEKRARKDADGKPILFLGNRSHRRGAGTPKSVVFSRKMTIPKGRR